jgi:hypothetical protein
MGRNFSKLCSLITALLFVSAHSFGQTYNKADLTSEWQLISQQNGVEIFIKEQPCDLNKNGKPVIFSMLKIVNNTSDKKSITYNYIHQYDQGCDGCDENPERVFTIELEGNTQIEEDCSISNAGLSLTIHNPNVTSTWKFESVAINILSLK